MIDPAVFDDATAVIEGDAYRHLFRARRLAQGVELRLVDGRGRARSGTVETVERRRATVRLGAPLASHEPTYRLRLVVAALRPERASWLVEKATELGVVGVHFIASQRTPRDYGDGLKQRLSRVAASAVEQSHRALLPEITGVDPWTAVDELLRPRDGEGRWLLDPRAESGSPVGVGDAVAVIGPEGGWSDAEVEHLEALGCQGIGLGERILRVETAALAVAARWLSWGP